MNSAELASSLRLTISSLHKGLRKQMSPVHTYSMTEIETIGLLFHNPTLLPTELATLTRITTQSMSQILTKLEQQEVIKRTPSKDDKRKVYISLTASGKKLVEKTKYERDEWLKRNIEQMLTDKEKELLVKALPVLRKLIEPLNNF
jgi:DNA-binding MarR family transcriptional regulator